MVKGLKEGKKPIVSYIGKHRVGHVKGITNEWYRNFLKEWKSTYSACMKHTYFFPLRENDG